MNMRFVVALATLAAPALPAAGAQAADPPAAAVLSAYENSAGGRAVLAGDYAGAIAELAGHGASYRLDAVAASTNLCVAYVMSRQWDEAHAACDEAVMTARLDETYSPTLYARGVHAQEVALAYCNRAVMHWLAAQPESAASDLARARALAPTSAFVARNLEAVAHAPGARVALRHG